MLTNSTRSITIAIGHHATMGSAIAKEASSLEFGDALPVDGYRALLCDQVLVETQ